MVKETQMIDTIERLKSEAGQLPPAQRADLAYYLISSLDESADPDAESAWDAEIDRRVGEIQTGKAVGHPIEDVLAELRERYP
jgi:putative addiction module component (TIGR02574 family)